MRAQGRGRRPITGGQARGDIMSAGCRVLFIATSKSMKLALTEDRMFSLSPQGKVQGVNFHIGTENPGCEDLKCSRGWPSGRSLELLLPLLTSVTPVFLQFLCHLSGIRRVESSQTDAYLGAGR